MVVIAQLEQWSSQVVSVGHCTLCMSLLETEFSLVAFSKTKWLLGALLRARLKRETCAHAWIDPEDCDSVWVLAHTAREQRTRGQSREPDWAASSQWEAAPNIYIYQPTRRNMLTPHTPLSPPLLP